MALLSGQGRMAAAAHLLNRALEALLRAEISTSPTSETRALTTRLARTTPLV